MTFLEFILSLSILAALAAFFVNGWYKITRHYIVVQPDNFETIEGYIGNWWSVFWEKIIKQNEVYYNGLALQVKFEELQKTASSIGLKLQLNLDCLYEKENEEITDGDLDKIERLLSVKTDMQGKKLFLYIEEPVYRFPSWVRNPISACPVCMSSVYGSLFYWGFGLLAKGAFDWATYENISIILLYPTFIIILASVNLFLARKL